jgi:hypothetical protein
MAIVHLLFEDSNVPFERLSIERLRDNQGNVIEVKRLGYEINRALFHRLNRALNGPECRNHDHRHIVPPSANLGKNFQAVHPRHGYIEKHELEILPIDDCQALSTAFRRQDLISHRFQAIPQDFAGVRFVVYNKDSAGSRFHARS